MKNLFVITTYKKSLKRHQQSQHEGIIKIYPCNSCSYQATQKHNLTIHIQSIRKSQKYPCDICDYQANTRRYLTIHTKSLHKGNKYPCDQCDYQAPLKEGLRKTQNTRA